MQSAYEATAARLAERLAALPASACRTILKAMQILEPIFVSDREAKTAKENN
jgi:hypothetical protein